MRAPTFSAFLVVLPLSILSCSGGGSNGGGNSSGNVGGTSGGGGGTSGGVGSGSGGIDGVWDITTAGDSAIGPSEMTINGGVVTGVLVGQNEGKTIDGCTYTKERSEFRITAEGNALTGSFTGVLELSGAGCDRSAPKTENVTGSRATSATGATAFEGEWEVRVGNSPPFVVTVTGLTAKAWDKSKKLAGREPTLSVAIAGGLATVNSDKDDFSFAAKHR